MIGPFVHNIDPIFANVGGFYLWYYGLSYSLGFLGLFLWLRRMREPTNMSMKEVYGLSIFLAAGAPIGGRMVEVNLFWPPLHLHSVRSGRRLSRVRKNTKPRSHFEKQGLGIHFMASSWPVLTCCRKISPETIKNHFLCQGVRLFGHRIFVSDKDVPYVSEYRKGFTTTCVPSVVTEIAP